MKRTELTCPLRVALQSSMIQRIILSLLIASATCAGEVQTVKTPYGPWRFSAVRIRFQGEKPCGVEMHFENATKVSWSDIELVIKGRWTDASGQPSSYGQIATIEVISAETTHSLVSGCDDVAVNYNRGGEQFVMTMRVGTANAEDVAAFKRAELNRARAATARAAEQKRATDSIAAEATRLSKLPLLNSGSPVAFLGADRKCAQQFQDALGMEGLEKRKRLADLVSYGCGSLVDSPVRVAAGQRVGDFLVVTVADGKYLGKSGWVLAAWLNRQ